MNPLAAVILAAAMGTLPGLIAQRKGRCFVDWWLYGTALFAIALPHALLVRAAPGPCIWKGVFLLATGQPAGMGHFSGAPGRFLASLASLAMWPMIGLSAILAGGGGTQAVADMAASACALLAPPVISYEIAARWGRGAMWPRFATAFNWCQWALPVVGLALLVVVGALDRSGLPPRAGTVMLVIGVGGYGLWLHWVIAQHGLELSRLHAALLVAAVNVITVVLVLLPRLLVLGLA